MVCRRCNEIMKSGMRYEQNNERGKFSRKKYYVCKKCHDRVYVKTSTFQECLNKALGKR